MTWWEEEKLLTAKDREAIERAKSQDWPEIDEDSAETPLGKKKVHDIAFRKYNRDMYAAGMD